MSKIIELINISKSYKSKQTELSVLNNFSLSIEASQSLAIIGRSGVGKTTLLQIMSLLDVPNSGQIKFFGEKINLGNKEQIMSIRRNNMGFVFQSFYLQPELTVFENVELPLIIAQVEPRIREKQTNKILNYLELSDKKNYFPSQISGGQAQRVAIARAMVNEPKIIFADEPTGNLDVQTTTETLNLFKDIQNKLGTTIVIVTHSNDVAKWCDRIFNLSDYKSNEAN